APRVQILDILILSFIALNLMYIAYPGILDDNTLIGRFLGFRQDAYFLLAYFVGRGLTISKRQLQWIMIGIIPGSIAVALVAAYQWVFPGSANALWDRLGFQAFVDAVGGSSEIAVRTRDIGGISMPRASSLLMGDLALAFYQLLLVPIAAGMFFTFRSARGQLLSALFLILMLGTMALSGARSAMIVVTLALGLLTFLSVSWGKSIAIGTAFLVSGVLGLVILTGGIQTSWFSGLVDPDEGSTVAHASALDRSIDLIKEEPLGRGLGTSHTVGYQLGVRESFANESWYLQIASETGILGAFLYSLVILGATIAPLVAYQQVRDPWLRALTLGMAGAAVGYMLVGLVLHVWEAPVIAAAFWLLCGIAVRAPQLEQQWAHEAAGSEPSE
ncbi:MAG: O-antigen ligase family protein, partial [Dehalococcoidia bacterium]